MRHSFNSNKKYSTVRKIYKFCCCWLVDWLPGWLISSSSCRHCNFNAKQAKSNGCLMVLTLSASSIIWILMKTVRSRFTFLSVYIVAAVYNTALYHQQGITEIFITFRSVRYNWKNFKNIYFCYCFIQIVTLRNHYVTKIKWSYWLFHLFLANTNLAGRLLHLPKYACCSCYLTFKFEVALKFRLFPLI